MTDRTHPDSVRITTSGDVLTELHDRIAELEQEVAHTDGLLGKANALASIRAHHIAELEAQLEAIGAGGVSGPLVKGFDAADMATASAQGFRDGVASLAASAGSEPVGYWDGEFSKDGGATIYEVPQVSAFGRKYGNIPLYTHPSPPEGMVGGWISVEDRLPKLYTEVLIHPRPTAYCCEGEVDTQGRWSYGEYETGFGHHQIACEVTHWMPLPPPPTTSAGSGKGE